jgi:NitT/TauT family transport system substrate-binding protein
MNGKKPSTSSTIFAYVGSGANVDVLKFSHEKGLFIKHGLQMTMLYVSTGSESPQASLQAVASGTASAATAPVTDTLNAIIRKGATIKIIMVNIDRFDHLLVAKAEIKNPKDLKGKKVAVSRSGSFSDIETRSFLRQSGLDSDKDVQFLQLGNSAARAAALATGGVDAAMVASSFVPTAKKVGFNILFDMSTTTSRFANRGVVASDRLIKEQPHTVKAIVAGFVEGTKYWKANPEEAKGYLKKTYKLPHDDINDLYAGISRMVRSQPTPDLDGIRNAWGSIAAPKDQGAVDLRKAVDARFIDEVLKEMK